MRNLFWGESFITVEVKVFKKEWFLNSLRNNSIMIKNVRSIDAHTINFDIMYGDLKEVKIILKKLKGKIKIIGRDRSLRIVRIVKNSIGFFVTGIFFVVIFLGLSNFVWRIDITSKDFIPPYEIRKCLLELGVKPGVPKSSLDVYDLEKKVAKEIDEIMWINIRIEGSTLLVKYEENTITKIDQGNEGKIGTDKVATMDGTVKRVYTSKGTSAVKEGSVVSKGDVLIKGEQIIKDQILDGEDKKHNVVPEGVVIADTFYEKVIDLKIGGHEEVRTGEEESEFYIELLGKKIYLKKANKDFKSYDKIDKKGLLINKNIYYEKELKEITREKQDLINEAVDILEKSVEKEISRQAVIIDKEIDIEYISDSDIKLKVLFIVEQDIASF